MNTNIGRNGRVPSDAEIEHDVAELRSLLAGIEGPKEPHPAYWQNFVVRVRGRIDEGTVRKRRGFSPAWATLGAAAVVAVIAVSTIFSPSKQSLIIEPPKVVRPMQAAPQSVANLAAAYDQSGTSSLVLTDSDVKMVNAIESNNDNAIFEALAESEQL